MLTFRTPDTPLERVDINNDLSNVALKNFQEELIERKK
jgi:hypothetical protein